MSLETYTTWPIYCYNITNSPTANKLDLDLWYIENVLTDYSREHLQTSKPSWCHLITLRQLAESNMASKRADIYQEFAIKGLYKAKIGVIWSWRVINSYLKVWYLSTSMAVFSCHLLQCKKQMASKMAGKTIKMVFCLLFLVSLTLSNILSGKNNLEELKNILISSFRY